MIKRLLLVIALIALFIGMYIPDFTIYTNLPQDTDEIYNISTNVLTISSTRSCGFVAMIMISLVLTISFMQLLDRC